MLDTDPPGADAGPSSSRVINTPTHLGTPPPARPRTHNDYTVGWICALSKELTAARAMLDQEHPSLPTLNDANQYILGSIGEHNIVIACLPEGVIGNNQAAIVATRTASSFRAVKVGLMVGIGGGIPQKVRLGDIVVSRPTGQYGGVVQWDKGKTEKGGKFKPIGSLNRAPSALLTALGALKSDHDLKGTKLQEILDNAVKRFPRLKEKYKRPKHPADSKNIASLVLLAVRGLILALLEFFFGHWALDPVEYKSQHEGGAASADGNNAKDETETTKIYYGLIASGNQVVKDAVLRDRINDSFGKKVLCIEMEAAGLMDDFPCIVIRGICDYADERKNDEWQEYAAATAAAYAKEFLGRLQPVAVSREPSVNAILTKVYDKVESITFRLEKEDDLKVLKWLTPIEHNIRHSDVAQKRQSGTGQWLLDSDEFSRWTHNRKEILFCPGIPGAGKTFLTSRVIDCLFQTFEDNPSIGIAYIYLDYKRQDEQTIYNILASILKQLACRQSRLPNSIKELHQKHISNTTKPSIDEIIKCLQSVIALYSKVFIVVDALDECKISDYCRNQLLQKSFQLHTDFGINLFATSRDIKDIADQFRERKSTELRIKADEADLGIYLDGQINQLERRLICENRESVKKGIISAADGMFLLARLYFESIRTKVSLARLEDALEGLAKRGTGIEAYGLAYDDALKRINDQNEDFKDLALRVLSWIVYSERPLKKQELQHALSIDPSSGKRKLDGRDFPELNDIVSVCAGLVTIDEESNIVRLIHYTTQEYFNHAWQGQLCDHQNYIAQACATYILFEQFDTVEAALSGALYPYAARNWGHHARKSLVTDTRLVIWELLNNEKRALVYSHVARFHLKPKNGIHPAAYFGLCGYIELLLDRGVDLEVKDEEGQTPLLLAAAGNYTTVVEMLLNRGADLEVKDRKGQTPLLLAVKLGHTAVVEMLLNRGADPDAKDKWGQTPLLLAVKEGYTAIVEMILNRKVDLEIKDGEGQTPLLLAAAENYTAVVEMLLNKGADFEYKDYLGRTALLSAAEQGHYAIMEMLLNRGADFEVKNFWGKTPVLSAAWQGFTDVMKMLLDRGADFETKNERGQIPLISAAMQGHAAIVEMLLDKGANFEVKNNQGETPLILAANRGHTAVVKIILNKKADLKVKDQRG
ncbi:hypothetical protein TWF730_008106 [Orbilia blumenaviensis]|uniref:Nucleoside phosphorylase domain-containing protein n=1 Tax=Orbilia blumenaviensis TaxID=1796055 RepID=A0AAV9VBI9_9PEZI